MYPNAKIRTLAFYFFVITVISVPAYYYLGFWFIYQLIMGIISLTGIPSGVAFWAHIGGFIFGMFIIKALDIRPRKRASKKERAYRPIVAPWARSPLIDIYVDVDKVLIMAYMPGIKESDIVIRVSEWDVEIEAEHNNIKYYGRITLPVPVIPKVINPEYRNGVLRFALYRLSSGFIVNEYIK